MSCMGLPNTKRLRLAWAVEATCGWCGDWMGAIEGRLVSLFARFHCDGRKRREMHAWKICEIGEMALKLARLRGN
jgi:hypothetical protein